MFSNNQGTSTFGGGGGLFGMNQGQTQPGFGQQPQNVIGGFGQSSGFGNSGQPSNSLFGSQPSSGFGGFGAPAQNQQTSAFGGTQTNAFGQSAGFGQPVSSGFGGMAQPQSLTSFGGGGLFGAQNSQNKPTGGLFGSANSSSGFQAGAASAPFGQSQSQSMFGGGGAFGQQNTAAAFGQNSAFATTTINGKWNAQQAMQQLHSANQRFDVKLVVQEQKDAKGTTSTTMNLRFHNIRVEDNYTMMSAQMLMLYDKLAQQKGAPQTNPEFTCQQQWQQRQSHYPFLDIINSTDQSQATQAAGPGPTSTGFGGLQSSPFGQPSTGGFSGLAAASQQPQATAFGGQTTSFFGGQQPQTSSSLFGSNTSSAFGQNTSSPFGGNQGFGLNKPQAQPGLFGGQSSSLFGSTQPQADPNQPQQSLFGQAPAQPMQGGLFGGGQSQGGLFGGAGQQANPSSSTGLFGSTTGQTQSTGGLFGQPKPPTTGGLFGQQSQQPQGLFSSAPSAGPTSGGLFGSQPQAQTSLFGGQTSNPPAGQQTGLFGAKPVGQTTITQSGGLFGGSGGTGGLFGASTQPKPATGGLFGGGTQPSGGGLFGQNSAQPASGAGGGLFGGTAAPAAGTGGGLFGQSSTQPAQGGLFGTTQTQQPTQSFGGGGLFGSTPQFGQTQQVQPQQNSLFGQPAGTMNISQGQAPLGAGAMVALPNLYQTQDPYGLRGSFLERENPVVSVEEDIARMQRQADLDSRRGLFSLKTEFGPGAVTTTFMMHGMPVNQSYSPFTPGFSEAEREEEERYLRKEELKHRKRLHADRPSAFSNSVRQVYNAGNGYQIKTGTSSGIARQHYLPAVQSESPSKYSRIDASGMRAQASLSPDKASKIIARGEQPFFDRNQNGELARPSDLLVISVKIPKQQGLATSQELPVRINRQRVVADLYRKTYEYLDQLIAFDRESVVLMFQNAPLDRKHSLEEAGITHDCQVLVHFSALHQKDHIVPSSEERAPHSPAPRASAEPADRRLLPVPPKDGYKTVPDMLDIARMTLEQLQAVPTFKLSNEHGSLEFLPPPGKLGLDLTRVNLARDFTIKKKTVAVYEPVNFPPGEQKPKAGTKLNVPCIVTLHKVTPGVGRSAAEQEEFLKAILKEQSEQYAEDGDSGVAEHISYDRQSFEWIFKVPHFTQWGEDDSEEEQSVQVAPKPETIEQLKHERARQFAIPVHAAAAPSPQAQRVEVVQEDGSEHASLASSKRLKVQAALPPTEYVPLGHSPTSNLSVVTKRMQKRKQLEAKIAAKKEEIKRFAVSEVPRLSNQSAVEACQRYGIAKEHQLPSLRGVRPVFRPIAGNPHAGLQLMTYHTTPSKKSADDTALVMELRLHGASMLAYPFKESTERVPDLTDAILKQITLQALPELQKSFRVPQMFSTKNQHVVPLLSQLKSPAGIFKMLYAMCQEYLKAIDSHRSKLFCAKLEHDFTTLCLLNALFGDPRVHLVQLHPKYDSLGHKSITKALKLYQDKPFVDIKQSFSCSKIRRNAVTEIFRFMNHRNFAVENKAASKAQMIQDAYRLMLNGEVVAAIRLLNQAGEHEVSLIVSQGVSAQNSVKKGIRDLLTQPKYAQDNTGIAKILSLVCITTESLSMLNDHLHEIRDWRQLLVVLLMYVVRPQSLLEEVVQTLTESPQFGPFLTTSGQTDLQLCLLKLYANRADADVTAYMLSTFRTVAVNPVKSGADQQVEWVVQHVLRMYSAYEVDPSAQGVNVPPAENPQAVIHADSYDAATAALINYMVLTKNLKMGAVLSLFIQNSAFKIRSTFDLVYLIEQLPQSNGDLHRFLFETLKLPASFLTYHQAIRRLALRQPELAATQLIQVGDYKLAHAVFMKQLAPAYFADTTKVEEQQRFGGDYECADLKLISKLLQVFAKHSLSTQQVLLEYLQVVGEFTRRTSETDFSGLSQAIQRISKAVPRAGQPGSLPAFVARAISEHLLQMDHILKCSKQAQADRSVPTLQRLVADCLVMDCKNPDLVRRAIRDNHLDVLMHVGE